MIRFWGKINFDQVTFVNQLKKKQNGEAEMFNTPVRSSSGYSNIGR